MEYISAEEFLKQPKEVQKVFIDWWKENNTILDICHVILNKNNTTAHLLKDIDCGVYKPGKDIYPLLTEGQLRQFVEDKTESKIIVQPSLEGKYHVGYDKYCAWSESGDYSGIVYCDDLLQAYWKVAVDIAKQC